MTTVVIVIHLMVVLAMIGLVLLQRSEGGALGIGGGQGAFLTGRSAGNVLTRSTAILAVVFFATSLGLALLAKYQGNPGDILERIPGQSAPAATETPAAPEPAGEPTNAQELLKQLGGGTPAGGPQTPPDASAPTQTPAAPEAPAAQAPAESPAPTAPASSTEVPAGGESIPGTTETAPTLDVPASDAPVMDTPALGLPSSEAPAAGMTPAPETSPAPESTTPSGN